MVGFPRWPTPQASGSGGASSSSNASNTGNGDMLPPPKPVMKASPKSTTTSHPQSATQTSNGASIETSQLTTETSQSRAPASQPKSVEPSSTDGLPLPTPKRRKLNAALQTTEPPVKLGLNGASVDQFTAWIESKAFTQFFSMLKENATLYDTPSTTTRSGKGKTTRQGPTLQAVMQVIADGEEYGVQKFSSRDPDVDEFTDINWYGLCLYQMAVYNMKKRQGIFFGVKLTVEEAYIRLWHAMLRATHGSAPSRQQQRSVELQAKTTASDEELPAKTTASATTPAAKNTDAVPKATVTPADDTGFEDPVRIQTLYVRQKPAHGEDVDLEALDEESISWYNSLEKGSKEQRFDYHKATEAQTSGVDRMEKLLDNKNYQRFDYGGDCASLGGLDPLHPRLENMIPTMSLKSWQVVGVKALLDFSSDKTILGCILADNTGLGKTIQCLGYIAKKLETRAMQLEAHREWMTGNRSAPEPMKPRPPKPTLLVVPGEIIQQWAGDIKNFDPKMITLVYYGTKALSMSTVGRKVDGPLLRDSPYFDGSERNARTIILTSPETLRARHGPSKLLDHRVSSLGWTKAQAEAAWRQADRQWERDLGDLFELLIIDEAHCVKNTNTAISITIKWMQPEFTILATATVLPNGINDFEGFVNIIQPKSEIWTAENLEKFGVNWDVNPYELSDDHPAASLRLTLHAIQTFITGPDASLEKRGFYLQKAWKRCLLRRTYASQDPSDPNKIIGESLPKLYSRRIVCRFSPDVQKTYNELSAAPLRKLAHFLPDGRVCWNRRNSRNLTLLSTALSYQWAGDYVTADQVKGWKAKKDCLWLWPELIQDKQLEATGKSDFILPEKHEISKQLALICRGSPKLRQLLQIIASLVLLANRRIGIWCSLPGNQILLHACFQALRIDPTIYTAELSS
ncbi:hypothetical protein VE02_06275 [Pseudogymnoascus sp. 03VT05]|nr:hypothetical protein VE02_06275 [Pseudogymnoascus sp. 03VT05]